MQLFLEGILFGLFLAFSMGPIFIIITQTSIQKGWKAGLMVGIGIWISDLLYIAGCLLFIQTIGDTLEDPKVKFWGGLIGAVILLIFGLFLMLTPQKLQSEELKLTAKNFAQYFSKGFFINSLNPFTPIFWFGVTSSYIITRGLNTNESLILLASIMFMIVFSDSVKVFLAQLIRTRLKDHHMKYISWVAGISLLAISGFLFYETFYGI